jgi:hypothetical protein
MKDAKAFEAAAPLPANTAPTTPRLRQRTRTWRALLLLVAAASLSAALHQFSSLTHSNIKFLKNFRFVNPADEFKDDVWPLRPPTPWDISTDYPFPRLLEFDVTEGTWLRLDVHPKTGDIVFDILGDIYCLPAANAFDNVIKARPVLLGVPHDTDPHFSPDGEKLVYRSDSGYGIENIWVTEWKGCEVSDLRPATEMSIELAKALSTKLVDEEELAKGTKETSDKRHARLLREGRLNCKIPYLFVLGNFQHADR